VPDDPASQIQRKLHGPVLRTNLLKAALHIAAFEMLRTVVLSGPNPLLPWGEVGGEAVTPYTDDGRFSPSPAFKREVLPLSPKDPFQAACLWLEREGVIDAGGAEDIVRLRGARNGVAHEMINYLFGIHHEVSVDEVARMSDYITKIGRWSARFTVDSNPEYDHVEIRDEDLSTPAMIFMQVLLRAFAEASD
jgi:hypothetical protein